MRLSYQDMKKNQQLKKRGDEVNQAIRWIGDMLEWCQIPFVLLGDTAKQVVDDVALEVEKVEIGVQERHITQDTVRLLKTYQPGIEMGDVIKLDYHGVPVEIKVIKKKYAFFQHPDLAYYMADEYKVPNPFSKYWKARFLVK